MSLVKAVAWMWRWIVLTEWPATFTFAFIGSQCFFRNCLDWGRTPCISSLSVGLSPPTTCSLSCPLSRAQRKLTSWHGVHVLSSSVLPSGGIDIFTFSGSWLEASKGSKAVSGRVQPSSPNTSCRLVARYYQRSHQWLCLCHAPQLQKIPHCHALLLKHHMQTLHHSASKPICAQNLTT